jgi:23S rRNA pseudouridine1911/1915/1917 synthase
MASGWIQCWQKAIEAGYVTVNGKIATKKYQIAPGDGVIVNIPDLQPTTYDIPILYENDDVVVFNKPAGVLTHSKGAFNPEFTVGEYMHRFYPDDATGRAGIVHRLDRDTSGVIIAAKNEETRVFLQRQFSDRKVKKVYIAGVDNAPKLSEAVLDWPIERNPRKPQTFRVGPNGKPAQTHYRILCQNEGKALLRLEPTTGRTHQLRVHLTHLGSPIIGDRLYGAKHSSTQRMMLHAHELALRLPKEGTATLFSSPIPDELQEICHV